jgi:hypothetical protein
MDGIVDGWTGRQRHEYCVSGAELPVVLLRVTYGLRLTLNT